MYDPSIGRWLEPDPIGFGGGNVNLYEFVGNSPTNYVDPSGLEQQQGSYSYMDNGQKQTVYATFEKGEFTERQRRMLMGAMAEAIMAVQRATNDLNKLKRALADVEKGTAALGPGATKIYNLVKKWFTDGKCEVTTKMVDTILKKLTLTYQKLQDPANRNVFKEGKANNDSGLGATAVSSDGKIAQITVFIANVDKLSPEDKVAFVLHEFTHAGALTVDHGSPSPKDAANAPVRTYCKPGTETAVSPSCDDLLNNAYSYEGFVKNYIDITLKNDVYAK